MLERAPQTGYEAYHRPDCGFADLLRKQATAPRWLRWWYRASLAGSSRCLRECMLPKLEQELRDFERAIHGAE